MDHAEHARAIFLTLSLDRYINATIIFFVKLSFLTKTYLYPTPNIKTVNDNYIISLLLIESPTALCK